MRGWLAVAFMFCTSVGCEGEKKPKPNPDHIDCWGSKDRTSAADLMKLQERVEKELEELDAQIARAVAAVAEASTETDRTAASDRLRKLQAERAETAIRGAAARAAAEKAQRMKGVHVTKECMDNPLAKGCLDPPDEGDHLVTPLGKSSQ